MKIDTPFFRHVPMTSVGANLRFRRKINRAVAKCPAIARELYRACEVDPLFYINTFVWTYDPRKLPITTRPMVMYPYQVEAFHTLMDALGERDILIKKSRDMGASWLMALAFEWAWHFGGLGSYLFVSHKEELVDKSDNPKALFWKVDFVHRHLPRWLMPDGYDRKRHRKLLSLVNPVTMSTIDGESTTEKSTISDRRTAILFDEFARVKAGEEIVSGSRDVSNSRFFNSTPRGTGNAYYALTQTNIRCLTFHWSKHPEKSLGLYATDDNGNLKIIDRKGYPADYAPILDGKLRSPWYDDQCNRALSSREIAQELDIDFLGSGSQFFNGTKIEEIRASLSCVPFLEGDLEYTMSDSKPLGFREHDGGRLKLWTLLDEKGNPPTGRYVIGCDISSGSGRSNSTLSVWNILTQEKVMSYANPYMRPEPFAQYVVALGRWLGDATLIWESAGPGASFGGQVTDLRYRNVYFRTQDTSMSRKVSDIPGWGSNKELKLRLLGNYRNDLETGTCLNHDRDSMDECLEYVYDSNGGVSHARSKDKDDPSGANANHGDRVMADALGWKLVREKHKAPSCKDVELDPPYGSLKWRMNEKNRHKKKQLCNRQLTTGWD